MAGVAMNCFSKACHCSFVIFAVSVLVSEQGVAVREVRRELHGPREKLDRAIVIALEGEAISNRTPGLKTSR